MSDGGGTRERAAQRRSQIREAAKKVFLHSGFLGSSTDAIMEAAGIASKETLYRYYSGKEALFVEVVRSMTVKGPSLGRVLDHAPAPTSEKHLRTLLTSAVREILGSMLQPEYLALVRVMIGELSRFPVLGELYRQSLPQQALRWLGALVRRARSAGVVRKDVDPEIVARMVLGTLLTYAILDGLLLGAAPRLPTSRTVGALVENVMDLMSAKKRN